MLVVPEVCAGEYDPETVRDRGARGAERAVGRPAVCAAVGVAEEEIAGVSQFMAIQAGRADEC